MQFKPFLLYFYSWAPYPEGENAVMVFLVYLSKYIFYILHAHICIIHFENLKRENIMFIN